MTWLVLARIQEHSFIRLMRQYLPNRSEIHIADEMVSMCCLYLYIGGRVGLRREVGCFMQLCISASFDILLQWKYSDSE